MRGVPLTVRVLVATLVCGMLPAARADIPASNASSPGTSRLVEWPRGAPSPIFDLVDVTGRRRTLSSFRGRVLVIFFGFARCPDLCPAELFKLSVAVKKLGGASKRVQVLFITLDPERDTPALLQSYVSAFDPRFVALTGSAAQVDAAASSFHVDYARVPAGNDYTIDHSASTFVLDDSGRLRLLGSMQASAEDYARSLAALAAEPPARPR